MQETAPQYIARIHSYLGDKDPVETLGATPTALRAMLQGIPDEVLRARSKPEKWSLLEQLVHLSDVEIVVGYRVRLVLGAEDGVPIPAFDQDRWLDALSYNKRDFAPSLEAFRAARENNVRLYQSLDQAAWNKYGLHAERGQERVIDIVKLAAGHDLNHLRQMQEILAQRGAAGTGH